jgi:bifunctional DNase/RNase
METLVEAEIWTVAKTEQGNAVLIRPIGADSAVPIFIGPLETQAILIGLGDISVPRPLTHFVMLNIIHRLGAEVVRVEINDLREGTYFARLYLSTPHGEINIDIRPSDALALVTRCHCPLFIAEDIVDEAGISVDEVKEQSVPDSESGIWPLMDNFKEFLASLESGALGSEDDSSAEDKQGAGSDAPFDPERKRLLDDLERAVSEENYEEAARIRDQLKKLGGTP